MSERRRLPRPPRSLRARLTAGLVVLLAAACLAVGATTVISLEHFLVGRLDQQLNASGGRFAASLEHGESPDADNRPDTRGQANGTFGARLLHGRVTQAAVVRDDAQAAVPLAEEDRRALAAVPVGGGSRTVRLGALERYRVTAVAGDDGDVMITGLPLRPVEDTVHRLEMVEALVFGAALAATAVAGTLWVRLSLRPLDRVATTAAEVTRMPLASGQVALPAPLPASDPGTEVGQVATALNRMLGHVGDALDRRHASEERLRQFAADAGHELRTPVAAVRAHAELALRYEGPLPPDVRHALERVQSEARRMSGLVDDLLLLARLDAGRPLAREPVDLTRLALDAVDDARAVAPGHRWLLDLPPEPVHVLGDSHRLHQVIANLLGNARTHTPAGTEVILAITLSPDGAQTRLTVTDNGPGIPPASQADIFDRFVRADHGRSRTAGGTGLGLAIVRAVTAAHGGTVQVTSRPGHTRFHLHLPSVPEPERPAGPTD
ncbi:HAMP domain-containing sensor histidine kinase [Streptomyces sp. NPDC003077]|uniref:sensor histidine kinase n=1 Tax=Streptomyces sp. NPDC003077 TaxID=3154443 RepID=UPI0033BADF44